MTGRLPAWMRRTSTVVALLLVMAVLWIAALPNSAGPDEPSHITRGAALVRWQLSGERVFDGNFRAAFELPAEVAFPDPGCYALQPQVPASCATSLPIPDGDAIRETRSGDYPIWGHLPAGVGTYVPGALNTPAARFLDALVPILLVGASLALRSRRGALAVGSGLLALTPMAFFSFVVVNPSGLVIGGGFALWTALLGLDRRLGGTVRVGGATDREARRYGWLASAGWVAMVLPRRDGLVYAALILAVALLALDPDLRRLRRAPIAVAGIATLATLAWASRSDTNAVMALFAAPFAPLAAWGLRRVWDGPLRRVSTRGRLLALVGAGAIGVIGTFAVMNVRTGGFDRAALRATVSRTGLNLRQAIGDLGWLDTPLPDTAVFAWLVVLGLLLGAALAVGARRLVLVAVGIVGVGVITGWTLTMVQNDPTGTYWQGRYYLPLLVGAPLVVGMVRLGTEQARRVGVVVGIAGVVVLNVALAQAMRRFAVGVSGSLVPTDWDTYDTVLPPVVLLLGHVLVSAALVATLFARADEASSAASAPPARPGVNVVGYHHTESGLAAIAREIHRSLLEAGVPCVAVDVAATDSPRLRDPAPVPAELYDTTVAVVPALQLPSALAELPGVTAAHDRLVGYWFWELDTVPPSHGLAIDTVDEIWVPTTFVRDAYAAAVDEAVTPVRLAPTRVPGPRADPARAGAWRREFGVADDETLFLVSLDLFSVVERKHPLGAIEAFRRAFPAGDERVRLIVKTINGDQRPDDLACLEEAAAADRRIDVVDAFVTREDLHALIAASDVLVSLHRSEGLGLHLADAMWLSTPVIATRWSGNLDLMDDTCAALVDATLTPVTDGRGAYPSSARWADPDLDQAAGWMQRLAVDADTAARLASAALARMQAQPSRADVGRQMWAALETSRAGTVTA